MTRLIYKSPIIPISIGLILFMIAISASGLEYLGMIDVIPGFGEGRKAIEQPNTCPEKIACTVEPN
jgi:hypothetical protein